MAAKHKIAPGGVDKYITECPPDVQANLNKIRSIIRAVVPGATETLSYFQFPGYHYDGDYFYNGMFAWFSYKSPFIRLHVYPEVIKHHEKELQEFSKGVGAVYFPQEKPISQKLVEELVRESLQAMKDRSKAKK